MGARKATELNFKTPDEVGVLEAESLRLAESDPVNDAGMIQLIAQDRVLGAEEGFKEPAVGVHARGVEDGIAGAQEPRDCLLELLMDCLGAADEADGRQAVAPACKRVTRGGHDLRMTGQAEVVVGAHIEDLAAAGHTDVGVLRGNGHRTLQRVYWHNKSTSITADIPTEAELRPELWGEWRFTADGS